MEISIKKLIACLLMATSIPALAQNDDLQSSIKDISTELASINQKIIGLYQAQQSETVASPPTTTSAQKQISDTGYKSEITASKNQPRTPDTKKLETTTYLQQEQVQDIYETIVVKMWALKKKYEKNPYIKINGFGINIGIPPSVTVSMEFKK